MAWNSPFPQEIIKASDLRRKKDAAKSVTPLSVAALDSA